MTTFNRSAKTAAVLLSTAVLVAGCTSSRFDSGNLRGGTPQQLQPVASSTVQSQTLPPLSGSASTQANAGGSLGTGTGGYDTGANAGVGVNAGMAGDAGAGGTLATVDSTGTPIASSGRDLSGPISVHKLLGAWTLVAGTQRCQLNLTQTTKPNTGRYRASTPGCGIAALSGVASWQLAGTQVQLFDNSGTLIGTLIQSGDRFIGTVSGGVAVSMVG